MTRPSWDSPPVTVVDLPALAATNPDAPKETAMPKPTDAETPTAIVAIARALDEHPQLRGVTAGYQKTIANEAVQTLLGLEWMGPGGTAAVGAVLDAASERIDRLVAELKYVTMQRDWLAAEAPDEVRARYFRLVAEDKAKGGEPMTAVEHPADGTTSELSGDEGPPATSALRVGHLDCDPPHAADGSPEPAKQRQGISFTVCYAKCVACQFGEHPEPYAAHGWADIDDIEHAEKTGRDVSGNCACFCAQPPAEQGGATA